LKINRLLAATLALVLMVGLSPAFADEYQTAADDSIYTEPSELATPTALATPSSSTILSGPGDFSGSETLIGFESLGSSVQNLPAGPIVIGDVTFSEFSSGSGATGWRLLSGPLIFGTPDPILTDTQGVTLIRIDFSTPVNRVGMLVGIGPTDYEVRFFDDSLALIETVLVSVIIPNAAGFAGIESDSNISRVEIVEVSIANGVVGGLDNLRFELVDKLVGGELLPIDSTALVLAGLQTSAIWMLPVLAGVAGSAFGVLYIKSRRN